MAKDPRQIPLPLRPALKLIEGEGRGRTESLKNRDSVARVLVEAGADLLLRRISPERAEAIEQEVEEILSLFDKVDRHPLLMPVLKKRLDDLESLMRQTRQLRVRRQL